MVARCNVIRGCRTTYKINKIKIMPIKAEWGKKKEIENDLIK